METFDAVMEAAGVKVGQEYAFHFAKDFAASGTVARFMGGMIHLEDGEVVRWDAVAYVTKYAQLEDLLG